MSMETPVVEINGKKVFLGKEDPLNPPISVKNPLLRYCQKCNAENTNERTECIHCGSVLDDGKMQCPICKKFFDFLVGDDVAGGRRGCEADWKPPTGKVEYGQETAAGEVFN